MLLNIKELTKTNKSFQSSLWQGESMKIELMSIMPRQDIGLKIDEETEQLIKIESGKCAIYIGKTKECQDIRDRAEAGEMIIVPRSNWYNIINIGSMPLKISVISALTRVKSEKALV